MTPEIIAAVIAALGAVTSGVFTAYNLQRSKRIDKLESDVDEYDRERLKAESEVWKRFSKLSEDYPTRREHEIWTKMLEEIKADLKMILQAVHGAGK